MCTVDMLRINLVENRRSLESRVLDLLRTKGAFFASNLVCAFLRWDVVPLLNDLHGRGLVTFHVVPPFWDEPFVVLTGCPAEWPRANRAIIGMRGSIGRVRFSRRGRKHERARELHGSRRHARKGTGATSG